MICPFSILKSKKNYMGNSMANKYSVIFVNVQNEIEELRYRFLGDKIIFPASTILSR